MNKRQKIVQKQFLNNEEEVIRRLESIYSESLKDIEKKTQALQDEINRLGTLAKLSVSEEEKAQLLSMQQSKIYQKQHQDAMKKQIGSVLDNMQVEEFKSVSEYLQKCYEDGFVGTMFDLHGQGIPLCFPMDQEAMVRAVQLDSKISQGLYSRLGEDVSALKKTITSEVSRGISTGMSFAQVAQQIKARMVGNYDDRPGGALYRAMTIARTEGHRIQVQSGMDACYKAKDKGADVVKQWDSTLDSSTRESHQVVDGEIRELDEPFSNGLMFPGDPSGGAAEVINCRCALLQRARWALGKEELETLKRRAKYYGLDKSDQFDDFKKKYLKAASDDTLMTRDDMKQRVKDNKKRISDINSEIKNIDQKIEKHNISDFDDLKGLKKSDISDRMSAIKDRQAEIDPIVSKLYARPERGTPEYDAWREWKRTIDRNSLLEEQMQLAVEEADLQSMLRKWDDYEEWLQWKKDNPLDLLKSQRVTFLGEIGKLEDEIKKLDDQLANMVIPSDWKQIVGAHDTEFDIKASNPHYSEGKEYKVNCQRCVPTYEMRRRGYDVIAKPNNGWGKGDYLSHNSKDAWVDADVHWALAGTGKRDIEKLMKEWGEGARAEVGVTWKGANSGHVFVAENIGGKVVFIDPQSGEMDVSWYFSRVRSQQTRVWRIDNLKPSEWIEECCERRVTE